MNHKALTIILAMATPALAQPDSYTYYGGKIDAEGKSEAVEECEYQKLVENQRCNKRVNKTECIREVHVECGERHAEVKIDAARTEEKVGEKAEDN